MPDTPYRSPKDGYGALIISTASCQHVIWSGLILAHSDVAKNAAIKVVSDHVGGPIFAALAFFGAACLSSLSLVKHIRGWKGFLFAAPQQWLMIMGFVATCEAIATRSFPVPIPEGYSSAALFAGQVPALCLIAGHTWAVAGRYGRPARVI